MQIYEIFIFDHNNYLKKFSIAFFVSHFSRSTMHMRFSPSINSSMCQLYDELYSQLYYDSRSCILLQSHFTALHIVL